MIQGNGSGNGDRKILLVNIFGQDAFEEKEALMHKRGPDGKISHYGYSFAPVFIEWRPEDIKEAREFGLEFIQGSTAYLSIVSNLFTREALTLSTELWRSAQRSGLRRYAFVKTKANRRDYASPVCFPDEFVNRIRSMGGSIMFYGSTFEETRESEFNIRLRNALGEVARTMDRRSS